LAILLVAAAVACPWLPSIERMADGQVDAGLKRAVVSFAAAKSLNAAISVAQGTEIALQPVGVGLTLTIGEALDPLNDLVEQFASLMLTASVAFGVQKALLAIGGQWQVSAAVSAVAVLWALFFLRDRAPPWLSRALFVLIVIRLAVPAITIGSDWVYERFLADNYRQAQQSLDVISANASKTTIQAPAEVKGESLWDKLGRWKDAAASVDVKARLADLQSAVDQATDRIVELMVVFVMQTIVIPIVLLWALFKLAGGVLLSRPSLGRVAQSV